MKLAVFISNLNEIQNKYLLGKTVKIYFFYEFEFELAYQNIRIVQINRNELPLRMTSLHETLKNAFDMICQ